MDPQVRDELTQLRAKSAIRELPPVGDIATRRRNYRRTAGQLMVYRPPEAPVDRQEYQMTAHDGAAVQLRWYRRALEVDPTLGGAHYGLAFLLLKRGEPEAAATHLREFLSRPPKGADAERWVRHAEDALKALAT